MPVRFAPSGSIARPHAPALCALALVACSSATSPTVDIPAPTAAPAVAAPVVRPAGPLVLFASLDGLLAPLVCHDGQNFLQTDSTECLDLAPEGATALLGHGGTLTLGPAGEAPCRGSELNTFTGRKATPLAAESTDFAVWPAAARGLVERAEAKVEPTAVELAAMVALLQKETEGLFEIPPRLAGTGGLVTDVDGDGTPDRILAAHEDGRLFGVVAAFLATAPSVAVSLSVQQFNHPTVHASTELDGKAGREVWITSTFVEGIEGSTVTSAFSERVIALRNGTAEEIGSFGCRMF